MLNLAEYRSRADRLADHLPWAALVATGVVLNNGSQGCTSGCNTQNLQNSYPMTPFSWRQH